MTLQQLQTSGIEKEFRFKTARSGGKGGQNVNKVETKVLLLFDVAGSVVLNEEQKMLVGTKLKKRMNEAGELLITEESERSQLKNKTQAIKKMLHLLATCFIKPKTRKATTLPRAAKEQRLKEKKKKSEVKKLRGGGTY